MQLTVENSALGLNHDLNNQLKDPFGSAAILRNYKKMPNNNKQYLNLTSIIPFQHRKSIMTSMLLYNLQVPRDRHIM